MEPQERIEAWQSIVTFIGGPDRAHKRKDTSSFHSKTKNNSLIVIIILLVSIWNRRPTYLIKGGRSAHFVAPQSGSVVSGWGTLASQGDGGRALTQAGPTVTCHGVSGLKGVGIGCSLLLQASSGVGGMLCNHSTASRFLFSKNSGVIAECCCSTGHEKRAVTNFQTPVTQEMVFMRTKCNRMARGPVFALD